MKHWDIITSGDAHVVTIVCDGMCPTSPDPLLCNVVFLTSTAHCQPEQLFGIRTAEPPRHHAEEILRSRTRDRATLHLQHCLDGVAGEIVKHILSFLEGLHRNCQQFLYSRTQRTQKKTWGANQKRYPTRSYLHHRNMVQNLLSLN